MDKAVELQVNQEGMRCLNSSKVYCYSNTARADTDI